LKCKHCSLAAFLEESSFQYRKENDSPLPSRPTERDDCSRQKVADISLNESGHTEHFTDRTCLPELMEMILPLF